jgi:DNA-binding PadR family transcriptional regulator
MPTAKKTYSRTDKTETMNINLEPKGTYTPTEKERDTLKYVLDRWNNMKGARTRVDADWRIYQKVIE